MTKRNRGEANIVNQMLSRQVRQDCQEEWEDWWEKNKDSVKLNKY
jgi:hypothetical protein